MLSSRGSGKEKAGRKKMPYTLPHNPISHFSALPATVRPFQLQSDPSSCSQTLPATVRPFQLQSYAHSQSLFTG